MGSIRRFFILEYYFFIFMFLVTWYSFSVVFVLSHLSLDICEIDDLNSFCPDSDFRTYTYVVCVL